MVQLLIFRHEFGKEFGKDCHELLESSQNLKTVSNTWVFEVLELKFEVSFELKVNFDIRSEVSFDWIIGIYLSLAPRLALLFSLQLVVVLDLRLNLVKRDLLAPPQVKSKQFITRAGM